MNAFLLTGSKVLARFPWVAAWTLAILSLGSPGHARAYGFQLTQQEWLLWPEHCKAAYLHTEVGKGSTFHRALPTETIEKWRLATDGNFYGMWHSCAGKIWIHRARTAANDRDKQYALREAVREVLFTFKGMPLDHALRPELVIDLATAYRMQQRYEEASKVLEEQLRAQSGHAGLYQALYLVQRDAGKKELALDTLIKGNERTRGRSSELHYFLGLAYLYDGKTDKALHHAREAYRLGYPLPGLKRQLIEAGAWPKESK